MGTTIQPKSKQPSTCRSRFTYFRTGPVMIMMKVSAWLVIVNFAPERHVFSFGPHVRIICQQCNCINGKLFFLTSKILDYLIRRQEKIEFNTQYILQGIPGNPWQYLLVGFSVPDTRCKIRTQKDNLYPHDPLQKYTLNKSINLVFFPEMSSRKGCLLNEFLKFSCSSTPESIT